MVYYEKFIALPEDDIFNTQIVADESLENPCIVFEDVTFTYPGSTKVILQGVSFCIRPGELIALVGKNGAGKSTIVKLLSRLYAPDSGRILINNSDIKDLTTEQLRKVLSFVFQDYFNYDLTMRENVAFGNINRITDDAAILSTLQEIFTDSTFMDINQNLGKIEDDGVDLSGGQWQRVALARALFANSKFVVLDEPVAALDPIAESHMYQSFAETMQSKGCLMISHRLASARICDRILVIDAGRVVEEGSHEYLMKHKGLYQHMFNLQSKWYQNKSNAHG
jgi:ABC-type multidrug transport system fused ATPase/permease subunit